MLKAQAEECDKDDLVNVIGEDDEEGLPTHNINVDPVPIKILQIVAKAAAVAAAQIHPVVITEETYKNMSSYDFKITLRRSVLAFNENAILELYSGFARPSFDLPGSSNLGVGDTTIVIETEPKPPPVVIAQPIKRP